MTEAGEGEDARIKSAIGIGSLLHDGIGDTIRVSLTEDSIHEIPVAQALVATDRRPDAASAEASKLRAAKDVVVRSVFLFAAADVRRSSEMECESAEKN